MFRIAGPVPLGILAVNLACLLLTGCDSDKPIVAPASSGGNATATPSPNDKSTKNPARVYKSPGAKAGPD